MVSSLNQCHSSSPPAAIYALKINPFSSEKQTAKLHHLNQSHHHRKQFRKKRILLLASRYRRATSSLQSYSTTREIAVSCSIDRGSKLDLILLLDLPRRNPSRRDLLGLFSHLFWRQPLGYSRSLYCLRRSSHRRDRMRSICRRHPNHPRRRTCLDYAQEALLQDPQFLPPTNHSLTFCRPRHRFRMQRRHFYLFINHEPFPPPFL